MVIITNTLLKCNYQQLENASVYRHSGTVLSVWLRVAFFNSMGTILQNLP